jgi:hypothetical protein
LVVLTQSIRPQLESSFESDIMKKQFLRIIATTFLLTFFASIAHADGRRGFHQKVYVVPAPGRVLIDGQLNDWDASGQILISVADETAEMQSARFAMMYDKDALYISGVVKDPTPLLNRHDPKVDPDRAWDADVCQIYLTTDPSLGYPINKDQSADVPGLMDMYLWNYTDRNEPALACYRGMKWTPLHPEWDDKGAIPRDKFQGAYSKGNDGRSYTMEYRIPWSTLGAKRPLKGGDLVAGLVQFNWSDATGLRTAGGSAWAYDVMLRAGFPWQESGCWGKVVFSEKGQLSPDLVEEGLPPAKPLPLTYEYDLPEDSEATIQLWREDGTLARTLVASAPRRKGRNIERWDGLDAHGNPLAPGKYIVKGLYHQPITTKFLFSAHNSGQPPYRTDDGTGGWGGDHGNPTSACALDDGMVLTWSASEAGFGIIKTDFNGKKLWGTTHNASDIATDGKRLFVVGDYGWESAWQPKVFDAKDGRPLNWGNGKFALDAPPGGQDADDIATNIAYGNGKVYVSWPKRNAVTVYDAAAGSLLETWSVPAPGDLAVRPDGSLAVISEGKVLALRNGRPSVLIDHHLDLQPSKAVLLEVHNGITIGADGTIYVANSGRLQDISVFDAGGKYLRSIGKPGGRPAVGRYDRDGVYEPGNIALDKLGRLWVVETTDYPKRISVWEAANGKFVNEFFGASGYFGWAYMDPRKPDELYCHNVIWKVDWKNNSCVPYSTIWRPTAPNQITNVDPNGYNGTLRVLTMKDGGQISYGVARNGSQTIVSKREGDIFKPFLAQIVIRRSGPYATGDQYDVFSDDTKWPDGAYHWRDANDDQTIQDNEVTGNDAQWRQFWKELPNQMASPEDIEALKIGFDNKRGEFDLTRFAVSPDAPQPREVWAYRGGMTWHKAINLPPLKPGDMIGLTMPLGVAGQFTGAASYFGVFQIVTKDDGIYVAQGFRDARAGGGAGPDVLYSETIIGQLVKPDGMDRIFFLGGAADGRVTEVLGLDTVKRLPQSEYVFTEASAKQATDAQAEYRARLAKLQHLTLVRGRESLGNARPVGKIIDAQRSFSVRAAYDAEKLYVQYDVNSPYELTNEITDPRIIFKGGNLIDIQIATESKADPKRKVPAPGDVRLLVTRQSGKPVAMLYRPKITGFRGQPIVLKSPANQESFDAIEPVEVGLEYQKTAMGFRALVTVPLKLLGFAPKPGQTVKMDVGYLFGNAGGNEVSLRSYWSNTGFAAGVIHDVPHESRLEPAEWGTGTVE